MTLLLYIILSQLLDSSLCIWQPVAKSRPQPQVLVPLRGPAVSGFASQPSITSKMQQVQQRASILGASGVQTFVSPAIQRRPDPKSASPSAQVPENQQNAPVQNGRILLE